jgi:hypothetical protein
VSLRLVLHGLNGARGCCEQRAVGVWGGRWWRKEREEEERPYLRSIANA